MPAITCYLSKDTMELLENERARRNLESKPQAIKEIVTDYFRKKGYEI